MPVVAINGTRLHVASTGVGQDVVMVHGLAANIAFWRLKIALPLAKEYRVTAFDLRGHGRSGMPAEGYSSMSMAEDLKGVLDVCGIQAAHLVGHSFGGSVVLEFAARYPERVRSLTLADATVCSLQPLDEGRDWNYWEGWKKTLTSLGIEVPKKLPKVAFGLLEEIADPRWQKARQGWRGEAKPAGQDYFVPFGLWNGAKRTADRWIQLLRTTKAWSELQEEGLGLEDLREITHPTLLMYGERSRWMQTCHTLGGALVNSETVILPKVGHFFPLLDPAAFLVHFREFLDRTRAACAAGHVNGQHPAPSAGASEAPALLAGRSQGVVPGNE